MYTKNELSYSNYKNITRSGRSQKPYGPIAKCKQAKFNKVKIATETLYLN